MRRAIVCGQNRGNRTSNVPTGITVKEKFITQAKDERIIPSKSKINSLFRN